MASTSSNEYDSILVLPNNRIRVMVMLNDAGRYVVTGSITVSTHHVERLMEERRQAWAVPVRQTQASFAPDGGGDLLEPTYERLDLNLKVFTHVIRRGRKAFCFEVSLPQLALLATLSNYQARDVW